MRNSTTWLHQDSCRGLAGPPAVYNNDLNCLPCCSGDADGASGCIGLACYIAVDHLCQKLCVQSNSSMTDDPAIYYHQS